MRKFFAVKGSKEINKIVEINGKAHAISDCGVLKLKDNMHSNTFLINGTPILKIYDVEKVDYNEFYRSLPQTSVDSLDEYNLSIQNNIPHNQIFNKTEMEELTRRFFLLEHNGFLIRFTTSDIIRFLQYIQSLDSISDFNLHNQIVKGWALLHFSDVFDSTSCSARDSHLSLLLGFFILLKCVENSQITSFFSEWKSLDLHNPDLKKFLSTFIDDTFLDKKEIIQIKKQLCKLIGK